MKHADFLPGPVLRKPGAEDDDAILRPPKAVGHLLAEVVTPKNVGSVVPDPKTPICQRLVERFDKRRLVLRRMTEEDVICGGSTAFRIVTRHGDCREDLSQTGRFYADVSSVHPLSCSFG